MSEILYYCPKCKRKVVVLLKASVSCSRCGRAMKRVSESEPAPAAA